MTDFIFVVDSDQRRLLGRYPRFTHSIREASIRSYTVLHVDNAFWWCETISDTPPLPREDSTISNNIKYHLTFMSGTPGQILLSLKERWEQKYIPADVLPYLPKTQPGINKIISHDNGKTKRLVKYLYLTPEAGNQIDFNKIVAFRYEFTERHII